MAQYAGIKRVTNMKAVDLMAQSDTLRENKAKEWEAHDKIDCRDIMHLKQKKTKIRLMSNRILRNYEEVYKHLGGENKLAQVDVADKQI
jgi:hypothetical protein